MSNRIRSIFNMARSNKHSKTKTTNNPISQKRDASKNKSSNLFEYSFGVINNSRDSYIEPYMSAIRNLFHITAKSPKSTNKASSIKDISITKNDCQEIGFMKVDIEKSTEKETTNKSMNSTLDTSECKIEYDVGENKIDNINNYDSSPILLSKSLHNYLDQLNDMEIANDARKLRTIAAKNNDKVLPNKSDTLKKSVKDRVTISTSLDIYLDDLKDIYDKKNVLKKAHTSANSTLEKIEGTSSPLNRNQSFKEETNDNTTILINDKSSKNDQMEIANNVSKPQLKSIIYNTSLIDQNKSDTWRKCFSNNIGSQISTVKTYPSFMKWPNYSTTMNNINYDFFQNNQLLVDELDMIRKHRKLIANNSKQKSEIQHSIQYFVKDCKSKKSRRKRKRMYFPFNHTKKATTKVVDDIPKKIDNETNNIPKKIDNESDNININAIDVVSNANEEDSPRPEKNVNKFDIFQKSLNYSLMGKSIPMKTFNPTSINKIFEENKPKQPSTSFKCQDDINLNIDDKNLNNFSKNSITLNKRLTQKSSNHDGSPVNNSSPFDHGESVSSLLTWVDNQMMINQNPPNTPDQQAIRALLLSSRREMPSLCVDKDDNYRFPGTSLENDLKSRSLNRDTHSKKKIIDEEVKRKRDFRNRVRRLASSNFNLRQYEKSTNLDKLHKDLRPEFVNIYSYKHFKYLYIILYANNSCLLFYINKY